MDELALEKAIKAQMRRDLGLYPPVWWGRLDQSQQADMLEAAASTVMESVTDWFLWRNTGLGGNATGGAPALRAAVEPWVRAGFDPGADEALISGTMDEVLKRIVGWQGWYWRDLATQMSQQAEDHYGIYGQSIGGVYGIGINGPVVAAGENDG